MKKDKTNKKKQKNVPEFKVILWEDVGHSVRQIRDPFDAIRYVDEDKTPFIQNEELNFMELYPQDIHHIQQLTEKELKTKLVKLETQLKQIRNKKIEEYKEEEPNTKDIEFQIKKLKARIRGLQFEKGASYVCFDNNGRVTFNFLRKGNQFFPFKWDTETDTIHTASEPVVKKAGILLRNKETKYMPKKLIETSTMILLAIVIIGTLANLFLGGWLWSKYDDSNLGTLDREKLELNQICSELTLQNAKQTLQIQEQIEENADNSITTKIQGLIPE